MLKGEQYVEGGAHAIEPEDGVLTGNIVTTGTVDTNTPGDYTVQYTVHDSTGHEASATRTVKVVDTMDKQTGGIPVLMYHYVYDPRIRLQTLTRTGFLPRHSSRSCNT